MPQTSRRKRSVAETVKVDTAVANAAQALLSPVRAYRPEKTLSAREAVKRNRIAQRFATAFSVPLESCQQALKEAHGNLMNTCKLILYVAEGVGAVSLSRLRARSLCRVSDCRVSLSRLSGS